MQFKIIFPTSINPISTYDDRVRFRLWAFQASNSILTDKSSSIVVSNVAIYGIVYRYVSHKNHSIHRNNTRFRISPFWGTIGQLVYLVFEGTVFGFVLYTQAYPRFWIRGHVAMAMNQNVWGRSRRKARGEYCGESLFENRLLPCRIDDGIEFTLYIYVIQTISHGLVDLGIQYPARVPAPLTNGS